MLFFAKRLNICNIEKGSALVKGRFLSQRPGLQRHMHGCNTMRGNLNR